MRHNGGKEESESCRRRTTNDMGYKIWGSGSDILSGLHDFVIAFCGISILCDPWLGQLS